MKKHYFTKNGLSDFIITDDGEIYINLINGEQITFSVNSIFDAKEIENRLIKMSTDEKSRYVGCFDSINGEISFFVNGTKL